MNNNKKRNAKKGKVLLTGGAGYIGSHTFIALYEAGFDPIILDDFSNSSIEIVDRLRKITQAYPKVYQGSVLDIACLEKIASENHIDAVIHFAAKKSITESFEIPNQYFNTNITGLLNVTSVFGQSGVQNFVFSSSATVYGEIKGGVAREDHARSFTNPYGFTKLAGEQILQQLSDAGAWKVGVLRYFNPVGADESNLIGESPSNLGANLFPHIVSVAAGERKYLKVYGTDFATVDGTGVRDYIHVSDLASGHVASLESLMDKKQSHIVNLGTGGGHSVLQVVDQFEKATGCKIPVQHYPRRPGDVGTSVADPQLAKAVLNFEAKKSLAEMCKSAWNWKLTSTKFM